MTLLDRRAVVRIAPARLVSFPPPLRSVRCGGRCSRLAVWLGSLSLPCAPRSLPPSRRGPFLSAPGDPLLAPALADHPFIGPLPCALGGPGRGRSSPEGFAGGPFAPKPRRKRPPAKGLHLLPAFTGSLACTRGRGPLGPAPFSGATGCVLSCLGSAGGLARARPAKNARACDAGRFPLMCPLRFAWGGGRPGAAFFFQRPHPATQSAAYWRASPGLPPPAPVVVPVDKYVENSLIRESCTYPPYTKMWITMDLCTAYQHAARLGPVVQNPYKHFP